MMYHRNDLCAAIKKGECILFSYCLNLSLPPIQERYKHTSSEIDMMVRRAHRWYARLRPFAERKWRLM